MLQFYSVIIDHGISSPEHGKEVVDGLNAIGKRYIYQLMYNVQLPGSKIFDSQILMHSCTQKMMLVWLNNSKKILSKEHRKHGVTDKGK